MEQWANGRFQADTETEWEHTALANAGALGELAAYERLKDLDYDQLLTLLGVEEDEQSNEKPDGPRADGPRSSV
jgi:hypothetical protein